MDTLDEYFNQLLAEWQDEPAVQEVIRNIMDEKIPKAIKKRLLKPLTPSSALPVAPPRKQRQRKLARLKAIVDEFDPLKIDTTSKPITDDKERFLEEFLENVGYEYVRPISANTEEKDKILEKVLKRIRKVRADLGDNVTNTIPQPYVFSYRTDTLGDYILEVDRFDPLGWDPTLFLYRMIPKTKAPMLKALKALGGQKFYMTLTAEYWKPGQGNERIYTIAYHTSRASEILHAGDIDEALEKANIKILVDVEKFTHEGSGWTFSRCVKLDLHLSEYRPFRGRSYFKTPSMLHPKKR